MVYLQGMSPENWVWELCPAGRRESTVICPPIRKSFISDQGNSNKTQKPIPLYWELLERFSRPGSTVAEFTAGSGTLAVACMLRPSLQDRIGKTGITIVYIKTVSFISSLIALILNHSDFG